jgi:hypothetical protein
MHLGGNQMAEESGQEVFEFMGKLRYYSKSSVDQGINKIPKNIKRYRLGLHKPGEKENIRIIDNKNDK